MWTKLVEQERAEELIPQILTEDELRQLNNEGMVVIHHPGDTADWQIRRRSNTWPYVYARGGLRYPATYGWRRRGFYPEERYDLAEADQFLAVYLMLKFRPEEADRMACG